MCPTSRVAVPKQLHSGGTAEPGSLHGIWVDVKWGRFKGTFHRLGGPSVFWSPCGASPLHGGEREVHAGGRATCWVIAPWIVGGECIGKRLLGGGGECHLAPFDDHLGIGASNIILVLAEEAGEAPKHAGCLDAGFYLDVSLVAGKLSGALVPLLKPRTTA